MGEVTRFVRHLGKLFVVYMGVAMAAALGFFLFAMAAAQFGWRWA